MKTGENQVAAKYTSLRTKLVEKLIKMAKRFKQRPRTVHTGIELLDRFFLDPRTQERLDLKLMPAKKVNTILCTCFLIASKFEEIDDRLVFIDDVQNYYKRDLKNSYLMPEWEDIVEAERMIMIFFDWNIGFLMPIHFLEIYLANGVLYENEPRKEITKTKDCAQKIGDKAYEILDDIIGQSNCLKNQGLLASEVAASIVYMAR